MDSQYYISIQEISRLADSNSIQCGEKGAAKSTASAKTAAFVSPSESSHYR
jgi:hypothetical protein